MHPVPVVQVIAAGIIGFYGVVSLVGGCIGYVAKASTASLLAGVICGAVLLLCAAGISFRPTLSLLVAMIVALALAGRFTGVLMQNRATLTAWLADGSGITAYVMIVGGVWVLIAAGLALLAGPGQSLTLP
jgi:uncharacterized membrane protein (UPF0136 family)